MILKLFLTYDSDLPLDCEAMLNNGGPQYIVQREKFEPNIHIEQPGENMDRQLVHERSVEIERKPLQPLNLNVLMDCTIPTKPIRVVTVGSRVASQLHFEDWVNGEGKPNTSALRSPGRHYSTLSKTKRRTPRKTCVSEGNRFILNDDL